jgi:hypothetical protein
VKQLVLESEVNVTLEQLEAPINTVRNEVKTPKFTPSKVKVTWPEVGEY